MGDGDSPLVGITGSRGYVGSLLYDRFARQGYRVVGLVRPGVSTPGQRTRPYEISRPPEPELLAELDTLIHCAWDLSLTRKRDIWRTNVEGTNQLLTRAKQAGVRRVIFVSSMSAYEGTTQRYGASKLASEQVALENGQSVVRLGLVYGPHWGGMAGNLKKLTELPITPLVASRSRQFTVHEEDVAEAMLQLAQAAQVPGAPLGIAHPEALTFRTLLSAIARAQGAACRFLPLPWPALYGGLRMIELVGLSAPFRSDSLLGLVRPAPVVPNQDLVRELGIRLRPFGL
jgi:nucleoside-diphosphate-sugar epimerase